MATAGSLVLAPVVGTLLIVAFYGRGPAYISWQDILDWLLYASALYCISMPAALAAHITVLRADAGHPVRSVGQILGYGSLLLLVELAGVLIVLMMLG
ncbi:hypothetical protein [Streptomyces sp. NPDC018000]|uniref:hypothetical protein n=1 Tax=Streptomyces sp. NPDC018000 TaxID=3365028 RepID=UPI0037961717